MWKTMPWTAVLEALPILAVVEGKPYGISGLWEPVSHEILYAGYYGLLLILLLSEVYFFKQDRREKRFTFSLALLITYQMQMLPGCRECLLLSCVFFAGIAGLWTWSLFRERKAAGIGDRISRSVLHFSLDLSASASLYLYFYYIAQIRLENSGLSHIL